MTEYMTADQVRAHQKRQKGKEARATLCRRFDALIEAAGLPKPEEEFLFHPSRKWRFDRAWPDSKLAVEIDGGVFTKGRHVRPYGVVGDNEKIAEAQLLGWTVLRYTAFEIDGKLVRKGKRYGCVRGWCCECRYYVKRKCRHEICHYARAPRRYYVPPVSPVDQIRAVLIGKPDEEVLR